MHFKIFQSLNTQVKRKPIKNDQSGMNKSQIEVS